MTTELERARAHLLWCQTRLRIHRSAFYELEHTEDAFLAALSWVWEEQMRASLGDDPYNIGYAKGFHDAEYVYSECQ